MSTEKAIEKDLDFTITEVPADLLLEALAHADSPHVTSMKRYIPYTSPNSDKGEGEYDVIYEVISVVRHTAGATNDDSQKLYAAANETFQKWYRVAISVWNGEPIPENDTGFWLRSIQLEPRVGASHVTIFGNIVDKDGRYISLTVTDQSDMATVVRDTTYEMWFYNEVSELTGHDLSPFGINPNNIRKTTAVDYEMRKSTRFETPKSNNSLPSPASNTTDEVNTEAIVCETISELRALDKNTFFSIKVGRVVWIAPKEKDAGMIVLNGFSLDSSNKPVLETKENLFMHGNRNGFDLLIGDFAKLPDSTPLVVGEERKFETPITVMGIKRIGASGKAFYDKLRIQ